MTPRFLVLTIIVGPLLMHPSVAQTLPIDSEEKADLLEAAMEAIDESLDAANREDRTLELEEGQEALEQRARKKVEEARQLSNELKKSGVLGTFSDQLKNQLAPTSGQETASDDSGLILGDAPAKAQRTRLDSDREEIKIAASERLVSDLGDGVWVFENDVVVTHPRFNLSSDRLDVFLGEGQTFKRTIATGRMVTINATDKDGEPIVATCKLAIYEGDIITLRDWPEIRLSRGTLESRSPETYMTYNTRTGNLDARGGPYELVGEGNLNLSGDEGE